MNKVFGLLMMFVFSAKSYAQYNHAILYREDKLGFSDELIIKYGYIKSMLLFNDTLSFYNHIDGDVGYKKSKTFGKKLAHHSVMYNLNRKLLVDVVNYRGKYLIQDDQPQNWTLLKETKFVLDYKCIGAFFTDANSDTVKAWYAPELAKPFGPSKYRGLPGVILELQDQRYNSHILAVKVDTGNFRLEFPKQKIVTRNEARRRQNH